MLMQSTLYPMKFIISFYQVQPVLSLAHVLIEYDINMPKHTLVMSVLLYASEIVHLVLRNKCIY